MKILPFIQKARFVFPRRAILALFRLEVSQVFKHQNSRPLLCGELDNAGAHQMGDVLIGVADLAPEVGIVLLILVP